jgi:peroxiredoxin Q/BCP
MRLAAARPTIHNSGSCSNRGERSRRSVTPPLVRAFMVWIILLALVLVGLYVWAVNARIARRLPAAGSPAPSFSLPDQNGRLRTLDEFRGRWLVLYFYPRDDTPGCAEQAMRFRNTMRDFENLGATVCGVSVDDSASHAAFARKYNLPFALLADRTGEVATRYGSLRKLGPIQFARRNTFLIDPNGTISTVYVGVNAAKNAQDVSARLRELAPAAA